MSEDVDTGAMHAAAAAASKASYHSFAEATGAVLDLLETYLTAATVFLAHLDRKQDLHRIVDVRSGAGFRLKPNQTMALSDSLDIAMAEDRAPRLCNDIPNHPVYGVAPIQRRWLVKSYVAVPLDLNDGSRVGSLVALSRRPDRFRAEDEQLLWMLARVLASELERETKQPDAARMNDALRNRAHGFEAIGTITASLAAGQDARPVVCRVAADIAGASSVFLLEPSGREFVSTAMHGVEMGPVTIQPRTDSPGKAFQSTESYFVPDASDHPALASPLVDATQARSALFQPILRDGAVSAVLILIWNRPLLALAPSTSEALRVLAMQAAAAINHAGLQNRVEQLAMTDSLTGLMTRRVWDEELPRELARARRAEAPVSVALLDLDHMRAFCMLRGEREGDAFLKETASMWDRQLREVDTLARLEGDQFGVILPSCDASEAVDVLDRIRAVTPREQTASAGIARWDGEEPAELLVMRAMDALSAAKSEGRDRTVTAD
ncbi:MAG: diguanylate cyclase [Actinomycetota bacterium]|nr:diguanylate cyclase [Actinomycetota bacterium]